MGGPLLYYRAGTLDASDINHIVCKRMSGLGGPLARFLLHY